MIAIRSSSETQSPTNGYLHKINDTPFRATTDSKHSLPVASNLLNRNFLAQQPNQTWLADITYVPTREGWLYLAAVLDLHSRKIVGWSTNTRLRRQLVIDALLMAIRLRKPDKGLLHHSDRGSQYCSREYQKLPQGHGIARSMCRRGDCWDNAPMESFFHTLKTELIHHAEYRTRQEAVSDIFSHVEMFHNPKRRHSSLGFCSPLRVRNGRQACLTNCPPLRGKITHLYF